MNLLQIECLEMNLLQIECFEMNLLQIECLEILMNQDCFDMRMNDLN